MLFLFFHAPGPAALFMGTFAWISALFVSSAFAYLKLSLFISPGMPVLMAMVLFSFLSYTHFAIARKAAFMWFKRLAHSQQLTMEVMVDMVETRDPETGKHIKRTQHYARSLAQCLKGKGKFSDILTGNYIELLFLSVPLHDIGKISIPDSILLKPGKLTHEEF